ncbi:MAG: WHG domain-containing protein [Acidimicrobiia bacterium]|nr:WHG domain-containing protein [Acidimicrobiia bacterium]
MRNSPLNLRAIADAAVTIVDRDGFDALTVSSVAGELGVGPSRLYTHIDGLDGLRYLVATAATRNLTKHVRNAAIGTAGDNALAAIGTAYRAFANDHPGQFASTLLPPRRDHDDLSVANQELLDVFTLVYTAMGLTPTSSRLAARSTRSAIHGFLALEHNSGTTPEHEAEYDHLLATLQHGLLATSHPRPPDNPAPET